MTLITLAMTPLIDLVAERYPRLKSAIDHLALPSGKFDDDAFGDIDRLLHLAKRPNVAVKASSMPDYTYDVYRRDAMA